MIEKQFFPTSILDEAGYLFELSTPHSITFVATITMEGEVNSDVVQKALDATLNYYPKCKCVLVKDYPSIKHWFRYKWEYRNVSSADIFEEIQDLKPDDNIRDAVSYVRLYYPSHTIDIARETPLKVMLIRNPSRVHLLLFVHHAAADGISVILFIKKLIQFYEDIFYQRKEVARPVADVEEISRPDIRFKWRSFSPKLVFPLLRNISLPEKEPPVPLCPQDVSNGARNFVAAVRELSPRQFNLLRSRAKNHQITINSYLLSSMFQAIKKWNQKWNNTTDRIYITTPVNLRSPGDCSIGNLVCSFYISYRPESVGDRDSMLRLIQEEQIFKMEQARQHINLSWFLKCFPLSLKIRFFRKRSHTVGSTLILSNMGNCNPNPRHKDDEGFQYMGSARICNINIIASPLLLPQIDVLTYNGKMSISLSVLRSRFSIEDAEEFLNLFIREIEE